MPAVTRKRIRGLSSPTVAVNSSASLRHTLAARVNRSMRNPPNWHGEAASVVTLDVGAFLVHLGRSISDGLKSVADSAEAARAQLRETRFSLHAAVDDRCDELAIKIESTEASKVASLERELVTVDAALERWRAESGAVREAVSTLSDAQLDAQFATLSACRGEMEAQLQALPTAVVEPPFVGLLADSPALLSSIACFGRVISPLPVTANDLSLEGVPSNVRPGDTLCLRLSLGARHAAQSTEELEVSLGRLVEATQVETTLEGPGIAPQQLQAILVHDPGQRCLRISLGIPAMSSRDSHVSMVPIRIAGQPVPRPPIMIEVRQGVMVPLTLRCTLAKFGTTPCISPEGRVFCPPGKGDEVLVFDADGTPLLSFPVTNLGLSAETRLTAYVSGSIPSLLVADTNGRPSLLVAVDPDTHAVRWTSVAGSLVRGVGYVSIAALPSLGAVVVCNESCLFAHRVSDGSRVGGLKAPGLSWFLAADTATGTVYGSICDNAVNATVNAWSCASDGATVNITSIGPVAAAGTRSVPRPLAVVPPAPGKGVSHLVVGIVGKPELLVLSLPDLVLVHTHMLEGMRVTGLAADPWGGALAVCDAASKSLYVLAWPLPGMPPPQ